MRNFLLALSFITLTSCFSVQRMINDHGTIAKDVKINRFARDFGIFVCPSASNLALKNGISQIADVEYTIYLGVPLYPHFFYSPGFGVICTTQVSGQVSNSN